MLSQQLLPIGFKLYGYIHKYPIKLRVELEDFWLSVANFMYRLPAIEQLKEHQ